MKLSKNDQNEIEMHVHDEDDDKIFVSGNCNDGKFRAYTDKKV